MGPLKFDIIGGNANTLLENLLTGDSFSFEYLGMNRCVGRIKVLSFICLKKFKNC